jgi:hypothetical protein
MRLPTIVIETLDGSRTIGMLYLESSDVVVLVNAIVSKADLGTFKQRVIEQYSPEARITIFPKWTIRQMHEIENNDNDY